MSYVPIGRGARVMYAVLKGGRTVVLAGRAAEVVLRRGRYISWPPRVRAFLRAVGGCACFPAGTDVATPDGVRPIDALHVGQLVSSEDPATGKVQAEPVQVVIDDGVKPLVAVDLADGGAITVTADHPFYVDGGLFLRGSGWMQAGQLQPGDHLRTAAGKDAVVVGLRQHVGRAVVYTLTVARDHTFFVGPAHVLVHNAGGGCAPLLYGPSAGGKLAQLAKEKGWVTLNDFFNGAVHGDVRQFTLQVLDRAAASGRRVYFDLTYLNDIQGVLAGTAEPRINNAITALELRYIKANWSRFHNIVTFLRNGVEVPAPWEG